MADELTLSIRATLSKSGSEITFPPASAQALTIDVSGSRWLHNRQEIGTSEEALELGDISTGGYLIAINRDATNYLELRSGTGGTDLVRINAGEIACFRVSSDATAPYAIANTSACVLEYLLLPA